MPSTTCAYCERFSHMTVKWGEVFDGNVRLRFAATCDNCGGLSIALGDSDGNTGDTTDISSVRNAVNRHSGEFEWNPKVGFSPSVEDVPAHIARAAKEAHSSASVSNHMAAILMARTVVEATSKEHGITSGTLAAKIDAMEEKKLIRPSIAEQAHEIRFMGNDMAHGDITEAPNAFDSEEILALMSEVLNEVFQGPARMQRLREKRQQQK